MSGSRGERKQRSGIEVHGHPAGPERIYTTHSGVEAPDSESPGPAPSRRRHHESGGVPGSGMLSSTPCRRIDASGSRHQLSTRRTDQQALLLGAAGATNL